jgi:hypothetical protein
MKLEQTECSETSSYKIQTPGNHPNESIQQLCLCFPKLASTGELRIVLWCRIVQTRLRFHPHAQIIWTPNFIFSNEMPSVSWVLRDFYHSSWHWYPTMLRTAWHKSFGYYCVQCTETGFMNDGHCAQTEIWHYKTGSRIIAVLFL